MSEFEKTNAITVTAKGPLLTSVSVMTLAALFAGAAVASEGTKPTVWFELGVQLERVTDAQEPYFPPFASLLDSTFTSPNEVQRPPRYSFGQEGRIVLEPQGSNWTFSAALRYGRSNRKVNVHEENTFQASPAAIESIPFLGKYLTAAFPISQQRQANTVSQIRENHLVLDFTAGKDVGLGLFGSHEESVLNFGVRFAQFTSRSKTRIDAVPSIAIDYKYRSTIAGQPAYIKFPSANWNIFVGKMDAARSFTGIGPLLSWDGNATLLGGDDSKVTVDWGLNGALLFGRQKMTAHRTTIAHHDTQANFSGALPTVYPTNVRNIARSRSVIVPNIGGFAGLSLRFPNAKVSFGYRVDGFFGAMDGGIDVRKTYDRDFYGPFATISIGLGG